MDIICGKYICYLIMKNLLSSALLCLWLSSLCVTPARHTHAYVHVCYRSVQQTKQKENLSSALKWRGTVLFVLMTPQTWVLAVSFRARRRFVPVKSVSCPHLQQQHAVLPKPCLCRESEIKGGRTTDFPLAAVHFLIHFKMWLNGLAFIRYHKAFSTCGSGLDINSRN